MAEYSNRIFSGVYTGGVLGQQLIAGWVQGQLTANLVSQRISGYMLRSLSGLASFSSTTPAGTLKIQVANVPNPLLNGLANVIPESMWADMPDWNSQAASATISSGATTALAAPWPILGWRWYRWNWLDGGLTGAASTYTPPTSSTDYIQINGVGLTVTFNTSATQTVTDLKTAIAANPDPRLLAFVYSGTTTLVCTANGGANGNGIETFSQGLHGASWNHNPTQGGLPSDGYTQGKVVYTPATSGAATLVFAIPALQPYTQTTQTITLTADFDTSATKTVANIAALIQANETLNRLFFCGAPGATLTIYSRLPGADANGYISGISETGNGSLAAPTAGVTGTSNSITLDVAGLSV